MHEFGKCRAGSTFTQNVELARHLPSSTFAKCRASSTFSNVELLSIPVPRKLSILFSSLCGLPAAVGIVRLSGPSAVSIVGRVFRPASRKKRRRPDWRPVSHVVEYGEVLDSHGNVIDEVLKT
ncbi:tRNA modification GTPase [Abeliophyllum distichum]|uniref:tRNA modification GTPase n=1 Tax=Abeliophyllum distichum TaxID=126358 RepID=A0ABD1UPW3_9LAMI